MPKPLLEYIFCAFAEQEREIGFSTIWNASLADAQGDATDSEVVCFEEAICGSVVGEFLGDEHGDAA